MALREILCYMIHLTFILPKITKCMWSSEHSQLQWTVSMEMQKFAVSSSTLHCRPALSCYMRSQKIACILPHLSHPQPWWTCSFILSAEMELLGRVELKECNFLSFNIGELNASTDQNSIRTVLPLLIWVITMHFFNSLGVPMPGNICSDANVLLIRLIKPGSKGLPVFFIYMG